MEKVRNVYLFRFNFDLDIIYFLFIILYNSFSVSMFGVVIASDTKLFDYKHCQCFVREISSS